MEECVFSYKKSFTEIGIPWWSVVRTELSLQGVWVWSLVGGEKGLRSLMPLGAAKKDKKSHLWRGNRVGIKASMRLMNCYLPFLFFPAPHFTQSFVIIAVDICGTGLGNGECSDTSSRGQRGSQMNCCVGCLSVWFSPWTLQNSDKCFVLSLILSSYSLIEKLKLINITQMLNENKEFLTEPKMIMQQGK